MPVIIGTSVTIDSLACASFSVRDAVPVKMCKAAPSNASGTRPHTTHSTNGQVVPLGGVIRLHSNTAVKPTRLSTSPATPNAATAIHFPATRWRGEYRIEQERH